jgi:hypothetical protein
VKLRSPLLGLVGLVAVGIVAMQLIKGDLSITDAATRVAIVAVVLTLVERLALPIARTLITTGLRKEP